MKAYQHIFFDLDRTLWDFQKNSSETLHDVLDKFVLHKVIDNTSEFIKKYNFYNDQLWDNYRDGIIKKKELRIARFKMLFADYGIDEEDLISQISRFYINTGPSKSALMPGAKELLEYLVPNYKLYIISNGFYDVQRTKMVSSGIIKYFTKIFTSDIIGSAKPQVTIFNTAISSVNARKAESIMIGDDEKNDIQGGINARIDQVYYNPEKKDVTVSPTYEVANLLDLKKILPY